jgi:decaprenyl-phosphate phosphoribosyltransferase
VLQSTRPRQWPKNLLVFAAPLAGATLGRPDGFGYAVLAAVAFGSAAAAGYLCSSFLYSVWLKHVPLYRPGGLRAGQAG